MLINGYTAVIDNMLEWRLNPCFPGSNINLYAYNLLVNLLRLPVPSCVLFRVLTLPYCITFPLMLSWFSAPTELIFPIQLPLFIWFLWKITRAYVSTFLGWLRFLRCLILRGNSWVFHNTISRRIRSVGLPDGSIVISLLCYSCACYFPWVLT